MRGVLILALFVASASATCDGPECQNILCVLKSLIQCDDCPSCPHDQYPDPRTLQCVCFLPKIMKDGICECPDGQIESGKTCIPRCPPNETTPNSFDDGCTCVHPMKEYNATSRMCNCVDFLEDFEGECKRPCPEGSIGDPEHCICIMPAEIYFPVENQCKCRADFEMKEGEIDCQCKDESKVPTADGTECEAKCKDPLIFDSSTKDCVCPYGQEKTVVDGKETCVNICPEGSNFTGSTCMCTAIGKVYNPESKSCETECPFESVIDGEICICDDPAKVFNSSAWNCVCNYPVFVEGKWGSCECKEKSQMPTFDGRSCEEICPPDADYDEVNNSCKCKDTVREIYNKVKNECEVNCPTGSIPVDVEICHCTNASKTFSESQWVCGCNPTFMKSYEGDCSCGGTQKVSDDGTKCVEICHDPITHYDRDTQTCKCDDIKRDWNGEKCFCKPDYRDVNGVCLLPCPDDATGNPGDCTCNDLTKRWNSVRNVCECAPVFKKGDYDNVCECEKRSQIPSADGTECIDRCTGPTHFDEVKDQCVCNYEKKDIVDGNCVCRSPWQEDETGDCDDGCPPNSSGSPRHCFCERQGEMYVSTDNKCVCRPGFKKDEKSGGCICPPGQYVQGSECVDSCTGETFYDDKNSECACKDPKKVFEHDRCICRWPLVDDHKDSCGDACPADSVGWPKECSCNDPNAHYDDGYNVCQCNSPFVKVGDFGPCECDRGKKFSDDGSTCVDFCPPGSTWNDTGSTCSCTDVRKHFNGAICVCNDDYDDIDGVCTPFCPSDTIGTSGNCVCTEIGEVWHESTNVCKCRDGFMWNDKGHCECVPSQKPSEDGTICEDRCSSEAIFNSITSECDCLDAMRDYNDGVCICQDGMEDVAGVCYPKCPKESDPATSIAGNCKCSEPSRTWNSGTNKCDCSPTFDNSTDGICVCKEDQKVSDDGRSCGPRCKPPTYFDWISGVCECEDPIKIIQDDTCVCPDTHLDCFGKCVPYCPSYSWGSPGSCVCLNAGRHWDPETNYCWCKDGLMEGDNGTCICGPGEVLTPSETCVKKCSSTETYDRDTDTCVRNCPVASTRHNKTCDCDDENRDFIVSSWTCSCRAPLSEQGGVCKCPKGQDLVGTHCVPICRIPAFYEPHSACCMCPGNMELAEDRRSCKCPVGMEVDASGCNCVNICKYPGVWSTKTGACDCPRNQVYDKTKGCGCAEGQRVDAATGYCVDICKTPATFDSATTKCTCPPTMTIGSDMCSCTCKVDEQIDSTGTKCTPICKPPAISINGVCKCPNNQVYNPDTGCGCKEGYKLDSNGYCVPSCPRYSVYDTTQKTCVCRNAYTQYIESNNTCGCIDGYTISTSTQTCEPSCPVGSKYNAYRKECVCENPNHVMDPNSKMCIQNCTTPTKFDYKSYQCIGCPTGQFYSTVQNKCIKCNPGYTFDHTTQKCVRAPPPSPY